MILNYFHHKSHSMDSIGRKVLLGIGAGISLAVSSVALYLLMKNDDDFDDERRFRSMVTNSKQTTVKVKVPHATVGAIIGRSGENIRRLQEETKTRITFDRNDSDDGARVLVIRGADVLEAEMRVHRIIAECESIETRDFLVPESEIGAIIGKKGSNIRQLMSDSGTSITVLQTVPTDGLIPVRIKGKAEAIRKAKTLIDQILLKCETQHYRSHKYLSFERDTSKDEKNFAKLIPTDGTGLIDVMVSAVNSPSQFHVQIAGNDSIRLDQLMDEVTDFYEIPENRQMWALNESLRIDDVVAAPYAYDEHWYRSKVIGIGQNAYSPDDVDIDIYYLDYGDVATLKKSQLCRIKEEFVRRLPFQAIECRLASVVPKFHIDWSEEAIEEFKRLSYAANWKCIVAKVIETQQITPKREVTIVELFDNSVSIGQALVEKGHAFIPNDETL